MRAPSRGHAPGSKLLLDLEHAELAVEEDHVDRESHEPGVDRPSRPNQKPLSTREGLASEQPAHARERAVRDLTELANNLTFGTDENNLVHAEQYRRGSPKSDLPIG